MKSLKKAGVWLKTHIVGNPKACRKGKTPTRFIPMFESMEPRLALSGNVSVSINRYSDVTMVGDSLDNVLTIERISDSVARVRGSGTKINGSYSDFLFDPNHNISISLNGGPDTVTLQGTSVTAPLRFNSISIQGGDGTDRFTINNVYTTDAMSLDMGGGVSTVDEEYARLNGTNLGSFFFRTDRNAPTTFGAAGHDNLYVTSCTIRGNANLTGGNALNEFYLNSTLVQGNVQAVMGDETNQTTFMTDYFASSGSVIGGTLNVHTGEGWGRVNLINTKADKITVNMGTSSRDEVWLYNIIARIASFDGGAGGADEIKGNGNRFTFSLQILNFERNTLQWSM